MTLELERRSIYTQVQRELAMNVKQTSIDIDRGRWLLAEMVVGDLLGAIRNAKQ